MDLTHDGIGVSGVELRPAFKLVGRLLATQTKSIEVCIPLSVQGTAPGLIFCRQLSCLGFLSSGYGRSNEGADTKISKGVIMARHGWAFIFW